ncbi:MAG: hypothetical protein K0S22_268 [Oscillospiraceae bacterium]|jgi:hypothetical protein|nr:hypothetical protein [Oscillospiraceae bacterium]
MVLGKLQSCFVIKLTATFSVEAAIFFVSPIKQHSITELLAYVEILNDDLYPYVVMSVADYASILRRYYGFKEIPLSYLKYVTLLGTSCAVNLYAIWNNYVPKLSGPADMKRLKTQYGNYGIEHVLKEHIIRLCHDHPWDGI